jgi:hypothetical protein
MSLGMYGASIPVYQRQLGALAKVLEKGSAWAAARKVDEAVLGATRLTPDMLPFTRQVQIACRFAEESAARLTGAEVPPRRMTMRRRRWASCRSGLRRCWPI